MQKNKQGLLISLAGPNQQENDAVAAIIIKALKDAGLPEVTINEGRVTRESILHYLALDVGDKKASDLFDLTQSNIDLNQTKCISLVTLPEKTLELKHNLILATIKHQAYPDAEQSA